MNTTRKGPVIICAECGAPEGCTHTLRCSRVSEEDRLRSTIQTLENQLNRCQEHAQRNRTLITEWQGRYMIVKHENNKLRNELYKRNQQETPFAKYSDMLRRLRALSAAGYGESAGAERLRNRMDTLWELLTGEEVAEIRRQRGSDGNG